MTAPSPAATYTLALHGEQIQHEPCHWVALELDQLARIVGDLTGYTTAAVIAAIDVGGRGGDVALDLGVLPLRFVVSRAA